MTKLSVLSVALLASAALVACDGSSSTCGDAGCPDAGKSDAAASDGPKLFGLSAGDNCYKVTAVSDIQDGCTLGLSATMDVGTIIKMNYAPATAIVTLGTDGSLGGGVISANMGTLIKDVTATDAMEAACMFNDKVTTLMTLTADNKFTISVTEGYSMFTAAPACSMIPTGGMCTSTWKWTMEKAAAGTTCGI